MQVMKATAEVGGMIFTEKPYVRQATQSQERTGPSDVAEDSLEKIDPNLDAC